MLHSFFQLKLKVRHGAVGVLFFLIENIRACGNRHSNAGDANKQNSQYFTCTIGTPNVGSGGSGERRVLSIKNSKHWV